jgi:hypothetical protein
MLVSNTSPLCRKCPRYMSGLSTSSARILKRPTLGTPPVYRRHSSDAQGDARTQLPSPRAGPAGRRVLAGADRCCVCGVPKRLSRVPQPSDFIVDGDHFWDVICGRAQGNLRGQVADVGSMRTARSSGCGVRARLWVRWTAGRLTLKLRPDPADHMLQASMIGRGRTCRLLSGYGYWLALRAPSFISSNWSRFRPCASSDSSATSG